MGMRFMWGHFNYVKHFEWQFLYENCFTDSRHLFYLLFFKAMLLFFSSDFEFFIDNNRK